MPTKTLSRCHQNHQVSHVKHPGDGFYQYVNQKWLSGHDISPWRSEFGVSDEIEDKTNKELLELLSKLDSKSDTVPNTYKDQLALLSRIWSNKTPENEESYIKLCLSELMSNQEDIARFFGWMCKSRIPTLINFVSQEEIIAPYFVRASLIPGGLTLPLDYYLNSDLRKSDVWDAYVNYVTLCSLELGIPFLRYAIEAEQDLAKILDMPTSQIKRCKGRSLSTWVPEFEWSSFMDGLEATSQSLWLLDNPEQVQGILRWTSTANQEHVVAVFALHLITFAAPYLRPAIRDAAHLFNKALKGVSVSPPNNEQYLRLIKSVLPDALCSLYSENQHNIRKLDTIKALVENLKEAAINVIEETRILSKRSQSNTIEKINRMRFEIGKVSSLSRVSKVTFYPESLLHTIFSIQAARSSRIHDLIGKPSRPDIEYPCFEVNASYYSESNTIVMPWGILQSPFFCDSDIIGWNYGGIGATIAHEITHAFDLEGVQYSPRAVYKKWWTRKNRNTFRKRTRRVGNFFGKFKHYGLSVDGKKTASEDWADFGGLTIALRALKKVLDLQGTDSAVIKSKEAYKNFFIAYAVSWRTLSVKEKDIYSMMTSVHALAEDRVDRIVPQFQEWVDTFDIQESDSLYIPRGQRLKFF